MRITVVVTVIVWVVTTATVALISHWHLAYRRQPGNLALDTVASLIALLACFLVFGRLRRRTRLNELMLAQALAVLTLSNLFLVTVPVVRAGRPTT